MFFSKKSTQKPSTMPQNGGAFFPWTDASIIGIRRFDEEHRRLAELINHIHTTMVVRRDRDTSDLVFERLIQETRKHFGSEEALLADVEFPGREAHFNEHSELLSELQDLHRQFKAGTLSALLLLTFLKNWLLKHIQDSDRGYVSHLRKHNIG